jgi:hypothetical protein
MADAIPLNLGIPALIITDSAEKEAGFDDLTQVLINLLGAFSSVCSLKTFKLTRKSPPISMR